MFAANICWNELGQIKCVISSNLCSYWSQKQTALDLVDASKDPTGELTKLLTPTLTKMKQSREATGAPAVAVPPPQAALATPAVPTPSRPAVAAAGISTETGRCESAVSSAESCSSGTQEKKRKHVTAVDSGSRSSGSSSSSGAASSAVPAEGGAGASASTGSESCGSEVAGEGGVSKAEAAGREKKKKKSKKQKQRQGVELSFDW